jgi:hypothetical protein
MESKEETQTLQYKVPRLLWESLESVLLAQSRRLIGDMARRLQVPEKELQRRVLPSADSLKIMMWDGAAESLQCRAYVQQDAITTFCRKPTHYPTEFCAFHQRYRMTVVDSKPTIVQRLAPQPTRPPTWVQGNTLLNAKGETVGRIHHGRQRITWFRIEE